MYKLGYSPQVFFLTDPKDLHIDSLREWHRLLYRGSPGEEGRKKKETLVKEILRLKFRFTGNKSEPKFSKGITSKTINKLSPAQLQDWKLIFNASNATVSSVEEGVSSFGLLQSAKRAAPSTPSGASNSSKRQDRKAKVSLLDQFQKLSTCATKRVSQSFLSVPSPGCPRGTQKYVKPVP